jgi:hypothetical protein
MHEATPPIPHVLSWHGASVIKIINYRGNVSSKVTVFLLKTIKRAYAISSGNTWLKD